MATKYAIRITRDRLDLLEAINAGVAPVVEEDTYLITTLPDPFNRYHNEIKRESDLYDSEGHAREAMVFI